MKRKISNSEYRVLEKELLFLEQTGQLETNQARKLLAEYVPTERLSFVRVLLVIGAILIGVGILELHRRKLAPNPETCEVLTIILRNSRFLCRWF